ncbi:uncharacterized protein RJT20DRAFT_17579 [Scheffersomyces xylosifermentans]|uniref:uncharacterized protein n=1 Tax=Scheffersomyces xylosifermentans TaxID=1304137 RepID=UPI00315CA707
MNSKIAAKFIVVGMGSSRSFQLRLFPIFSCLVLKVVLFWKTLPEYEDHVPKCFLIHQMILSISLCTCLCSFVTCRHNSQPFWCRKVSHFFAVLSLSVLAIFLSDYFSRYILATQIGHKGILYTGREGGSTTGIAMGGICVDVK